VGTHKGLVLNEPSNRPHWVVFRLQEPRHLLPTHQGTWCIIMQLGRPSSAHESEILDIEEEKVVIECIFQLHRLGIPARPSRIPSEHIRRNRRDFSISSCSRTIIHPFGSLFRRGAVVNDETGLESSNHRAGYTVSCQPTPGCGTALQHESTCIDISMTCNAQHKKPSNCHPQ
jgi:hypothetical protein